MEAFAKKPATYDDLCQVPDDLLAQLIDGELIATPRPASLHSVAATELLRALPGSSGRRAGGGGAGGWRFLIEPELHLAQDVLVPDLAGWKRETLPQIPDAPAIEVAPDWICEVLSPGTEALDRVKKMGRYALHGVGHVWLVNPREKTLEVFQRQGSMLVGVSTFSGDEKVRAPPFDAMELDLAALWER